MLRERVLGIYPNERKEVVGTQAEVLASTQPDGVFGICEDTGAMVQRVGGTWTGGTISYPSVPGVNVGAVVNVGGVVYGWDEELVAYVAQRSVRLRNPPLSLRGRALALGSSSITNSESTVSGIDLPSFRSLLGEANFLLGDGWELDHMGYSSQGNAVILTHLAEAYAWDPDVLFLALSYNDLAANTEAAAEAAFATLQATALDAIRRGIAVVIITPHYNGANWRAALHYDCLCQEWGASLGIPVVSGARAMCAGTDLVGTAKAGEMSDSLHVNDVGVRNSYAVEIVNVVTGAVVRRITHGGSAQVASQLFVNPGLVGSTAVTETGFSGYKPSGWTLARVGSASIVSSVGTDDAGNYWDLSVTSTASDEYLTISDATFTATLAAATLTRFREIVDYEIVTPGLIENVRAFLPFSSGTIQVPNGNSMNFTGTMHSGKRQIVTPGIDLAKTGVAQAANSAGVRVSFSGAGTTVLRLRGISARESRW